MMQIIMMIDLECQTTDVFWGVALPNSLDQDRQFVLNTLLHLCRGHYGDQTPAVVVSNGQSP